ncbi:glucosaminidase domain-containing protein [Saccharothrix variisporea]|uniref:Mannosyl-glycoprotein endo-beta-N-acetylglucosaminidase n=1 Tax=Saccharothrix variisporea TaxID=543527 RepID=A0A495XL56_9PSEU|nr:glucosaminidase domain-containing protein [Saccharothrix variisporea]RKT74837.1 mannosyl-glycoprotein endo-beta-N-acetylglucosaminidase [Saccharothrix variisporea]
MRHIPIGHPHGTADGRGTKVGTARPPDLLTALQAAVGNRATTAFLASVQRQSHGHRSGGRAADPDPPGVEHRLGVATPGLDVQAGPLGADADLTPELVNQFRRNKANVVAFVGRYRAQAVAEQRAARVPAAFTLGQMGLETGWRLESPFTGHNLFGVTSREDRPEDQWTYQRTVVRVPSPAFERRDLRPARRGGRVVQRDRVIRPADGSNPLRRVGDHWEYTALRPFRVYPDEATAMADHTSLLHHRIYAAAWARADDPALFARAVAEAGYGGHNSSSNPLVVANYRAELLSAIRLVEAAAALWDRRPDIAREADHWWRTQGLPGERERRRRPRRSDTSPSTP